MRGGAELILAGHKGLTLGRTANRSWVDTCGRSPLFDGYGRLAPTNLVVPLEVVELVLELT